MKILTSLEKWFDDDLPMTNTVRLSIFLSVMAVFTGLFFYFVKTEKPVTPCMPVGSPGRCYYVAEDICNVIWEKSNLECDDYIKTMSLPPGRLIGPLKFKCQLAHMDRAFHLNLKSTPECKQMGLEIAEWTRRNDFK